MIIDSLPLLTINRRGPEPKTTDSITEAKERELISI